jgi:Tol biopolymer transport system component
MLPSHPSFSPDVARIAFTVTLQQYPTHLAVFVVDTDGTHRRALVRDWYNASDPAWRPAP